MSDDDDGLLALISDSAERFLEGRDAQAGPVPWSDLVEMGWTGLLLAEDRGGAGLGLDAAAALMQRFGAAICESPLLAHALVPSLVLQALPGGAERDALAAGIADGSAPLALAWLERADQLVPEAATVTLADGRLRGTKMFVPMMAGARLVVSATVPGEGPALLLVDADAPGISSAALTMNDGSRAAHCTFDVAEDAVQVLARGNAAGHALKTAVLGAAVLRSAQLSGLADATLEKTRVYLHQRKQFDQLLSQMQVLQHRMVDLFMQCRLAGASWRNAVRELAERPASAEAAAAVSAAKARCSDVALLVAKSAIQLHGAFGFTAEGGLGHALDKSLAWGASYGSGALHRRRFRHLIKGAAA